MLDFITDTQIYERVIRGRVPKAKEFVWLATADLKDLYVNKPGRKRMVPFLEILSDLAAKGVEIRLLHAKEPGPAFQGVFYISSRTLQLGEQLLRQRSLQNTED